MPKCYLKALTGACIVFTILALQLIVSQNEETRLRYLVGPKILLSPNLPEKYVRKFEELEIIMEPEEVSDAIFREVLFVTDD